MRVPKTQPEPARTIRCAVYTRKSTEEGLEQEFNTLDAQREAGEAYIKSQQHEGWVCVPDHYDDGGFTGANLDRPAMKRLLADIESGAIDCVVVYKVDRLSRSLTDFSKIMETFDRHQVAFVSVTQAFNTASSMGRLMLNVLLSFAQFEREMISERTRDKIAATRRKGKWSGGMPILGYDVVDTKLVVNEVEAAKVRQIFELYLERRSILETVKELNRRRWLTKSWTTRRETNRGGKLFTKNSLFRLLTNVTYLGQLQYKDETHQGEHEGIVDPEVFGQAQRLLKRNGKNGGRDVRNKLGALLRRILRCATCNCAMVHSFTTKGKRRYRYYICMTAQQRGWHVCAAPSLPAAEIEKFVVNQIKCIGKDPRLLDATLAETRHQSKLATQRLAGEKTALIRQCRADEAELRRLAESPIGKPRLVASIQERVASAERRMSEVESELAALAAIEINQGEVAVALGDFDSVWDSLAPREQGRILELLIERVDHDGKNGNIAITFHPAGIKSLVGKLTELKKAAV